MPGNPLTDPNWATDVTDSVVRMVGTVRDKTTRPLVNATRTIVLALLAAVLGLVALVLFVIAFTRGIQAVLEWPFDHDTAVWASYLIAGGIVTLAGLFVLRKRHPRAS
jgi:uncharacterized BrkB/YihY/UPF0761 family membrane protein